MKDLIIDSIKEMSKKEKALVTRCKYCVHSIPSTAYGFEDDEILVCELHSDGAVLQFRNEQDYCSRGK